MGHLKMSVVMSLGGFNSRETWKSSIMLRGDGAFNLTPASTTATKFATLLSLVMPETVYIQKILVSECDAFGKITRGKTYTNIFNNVGQVAVPEDEIVNPGNHVYNLMKRASEGRIVYAPFRHMIFSGEYDTYVTTGALPARLTSTNLTGLFSTPFPAAYKALGVAESFTMVLPQRADSDDTDSRAVTSCTGFNFAELQEHSDQRPSYVALREGIQAQINQIIKNVKYALRSFGGVETNAGYLLAVRDTVLEARNLRDSLPPIERARLKWDAVLDNALIVALT